MDNNVEWEGWHFLPANRKLRFFPYTLVEPGQTLCVKPPPILHQHGLHASKRVIDALEYASGPTVERVRLGGKIIEDKTKAVATERTCLWLADATRVLHEFTCWCTEQVLLQERTVGHDPDPRLWMAIEAKRKWVRGEIEDTELITAKNTALNVAGKMTWIVDWVTNRKMVWNAARNVVWFMAQKTAWDAITAMQNDKLEEMLWTLAP